MQEGPYYVVERPAFTARFLLGNDSPESAQDADVHVHLAAGTVRYITFYTLPAIEQVLQRHRLSGETAISSPHLLHRRQLFGHRVRHPLDADRAAGVSRRVGATPGLPGPPGALDQRHDE